MLFPLSIHNKFCEFVPSFMVISYNMLFVLTLTGVVVGAVSTGGMCLHLALL